jgi:hypothetical protein
MEIVEPTHLSPHRSPTPNPNTNPNLLPPFKKGHSGNPSGKPKGTRDLAKKILEKTKDGEELVEKLLSLARGEVKRARPADQLKAIEMLFDRAYGKSVAHTDVTGDVQVGVTYRNMDNFSDDELRELVSLRKELVAAGPIVETTGHIVDGDTTIDGRGETETS